MLLNSAGVRRLTDLRGVLEGEVVCNSQAAAVSGVRPSSWLSLVRISDSARRKAKAGMSSGNVSNDSASGSGEGMGRGVGIEGSMRGLIRSATAPLLRSPSPLPTPHPSHHSHHSHYASISAHTQPQEQQQDYTGSSSPRAQGGLPGGAVAGAVESEVSVAERAALPGAHLVYGCVVALQSLMSGGFLQMMVDSLRPEAAWSGASSSSELDGTFTWCEATAPNPLVAFLRGQRPPASTLLGALGSNSDGSSGGSGGRGRRGSLTTLPLNDRLLRSSFFRILNAANPLDRSEVKAGDSIALEVLLYDNVSTRWVIGARVLLDKQTDPRYSRSNMAAAMTQTPFATAEEHLHRMHSDPQKDADSDRRKNTLHAGESGGDEADLPQPGNSIELKAPSTQPSAPITTIHHHSAAMWKAAAVPLVTFDGMVGDRDATGSPPKRARSSNAGAAKMLIPPAHPDVPQALRIYEPKKKLKLSEMASRNVADATAASKRLGCWKVRLHNAHEATGALVSAGAASKMSASDIMEGYDGMVNFKARSRDKVSAALAPKAADDEDDADLAKRFHAEQVSGEVGHLAVISLHMDWGHLAVTSTLDDPSLQLSNVRQQDYAAPFDVVVEADSHDTKPSWDKEQKGSEVPESGSTKAGEHPTPFASSTVAVSAAVVHPRLVSRDVNVSAGVANDLAEEDAISGRRTADRKALLREQMIRLDLVRKIPIAAKQDSADAAFMTEPTGLREEEAPRFITDLDVADALQQVAGEKTAAELADTEVDAAKAFLQKVQTPSALLRQTGRTGMFDVPRVSAGGMWRVWMCAPSLSAFTRTFQSQLMAGSQEAGRNMRSNSIAASDNMETYRAETHRSNGDEDSRFPRPSTTGSVVSPAGMQAAKMRFGQSDIQRYNTMLDKATRQLRSQMSERTVTRQRNVTHLVSAEIQHRKAMGLATAAAVNAVRTQGDVALSTLPWFANASDFEEVSPGVQIPKPDMRTPMVLKSSSSSQVFFPPSLSSPKGGRGRSDGVGARPTSPGRVWSPKSAKSPGGRASRGGHTQQELLAEETITTARIQESLAKAEAEAKAQALEATVPTSFWRAMTREAGLSSLMAGIDAERDVARVLTALHQIRHPDDPMLPAIDTSNSAAATAPRLKARRGSLRAQVEAVRAAERKRAVPASTVVKAVKAIQRRWRVKKQMNMKWHDALLTSDYRVARLIAKGLPPPSDALSPSQPMVRNGTTAAGELTMPASTRSRSVSTASARMRTASTGEAIHKASAGSEERLDATAASGSGTLSLRGNKTPSHHIPPAGSHAARLIEYLDTQASSKHDRFSDLRRQFQNSHAEAGPVRVPSLSSMQKPIKPAVLPLLEKVAEEKASLPVAGVQAPAHLTRVRSAGALLRSASTGASKAHSGTPHSASRGKPRIMSAATASTSLSITSISQLPVDNSSAPPTPGQWNPKARAAYACAFTPHVHNDSKRRSTSAFRAGDRDVGATSPHEASSLRLLARHNPKLFSDVGASAPNSMFAHAMSMIAIAEPKAARRSHSPGSTTGASHF